MIIWNIMKQSSNIRFESTKWDPKILRPQLEVAPKHLFHPLLHDRPHACAAELKHFGWRTCLWKPRCVFSTYLLQIYIFTIFYSFSIINIINYRYLSAIAWSGLAADSPALGSEPTGSYGIHRFHSFRMTPGGFPIFISRDSWGKLRNWVPLVSGIHKADEDFSPRESRITVFPSVEQHQHQCTQQHNSMFICSVGPIIKILRPAAWDILFAIERVNSFAHSKQAAHQSKCFKHLDFPAPKSFRLADLSVFTEKMKD